MLRRAFLLCFAAGCSSFSSEPASVVDRGSGDLIDAGDASPTVVLPDGAPVPTAEHLANIGSPPRDLAASGPNVVVTSNVGIQLFQNGQPMPDWVTLTKDETIAGPVIFSDLQTAIFTTNDHVRRCVIDGTKCESSGSDLKLAGASTSLTASAERLLVGKLGALASCSLPSCAGPKMLSLQSEPPPLALALSGSIAFIGEPNQIRTASIQGDGTPTNPDTFGTGGALSMATSLTELYWADNDGNLFGCANTTQRCASPRSLAERRSGAHDLAFKNGSLYWLEPSGVVYRCDPNACAPQAVVVVDGATHLALGERIYLANNSAIWAAPF